MGKEIADIPSGQPTMAGDYELDEEDASDADVDEQVA
jgi:hypothetical protein